MDKKLAVSKLAEKVIKYSKVEHDKALITFTVPFELWKEIYQECVDLEKQNITDAYDEPNIQWIEEIDEDGRLTLSNKYKSSSEYFFCKYKL
jgi:hypothetical protein